MIFISLRVIGAHAGMQQNAVHVSENMPDCQVEGWNKPWAAEYNSDLWYRSGWTQA